MAKQTKAEAAAALRQFRTKVSKLKKAGILSSSVDPRSQKMTKYMKRMVKDYDDVATGKAKAVKLKGTKSEIAAQQANYAQFKSKNDRIIVPIREGENVTFSKKKGLGATRRAYGKIFRVQYSGQFLDHDINSLRRYIQQGHTLSIGFRYGNTGKITYRYFSGQVGLDNLISDMANYQNYKDWQDYVEVLTIVGHYRDAEFNPDEDGGDEGDDSNGYDDPTGRAFENRDPDWHARNVIVGKKSRKKKSSRKH